MVCETFILCLAFTLKAIKVTIEVQGWMRDQRNSVYEIGYAGYWWGGMGIYVVVRHLLRQRKYVNPNLSLSGRKDFDNYMRGFTDPGGSQKDAGLSGVLKHLGMVTGKLTQTIRNQSLSPRQVPRRSLRRKH